MVYLVATSSQNGGKEMIMDPGLPAGRKRAHSLGETNVLCGSRNKVARRWGKAIPRFRESGSQTQARFRDEQGQAHKQAINHDP